MSSLAFLSSLSLFPFPSLPFPFLSFPFLLFFLAWKGVNIVYGADKGVWWHERAHASSTWTRLPSYFVMVIVMDTNAHVYIEMIRIRIAAEQAGPHQAHVEALTAEVERFRSLAFQARRDADLSRASMDAMVVCIRVGWVAVCSISWRVGIYTPLVPFLMRCRLSRGRSCRR